MSSENGVPVPVPPVTSVPDVTGTPDIPAKEQDLFANVKIGLAATAVIVTGGITGLLAAGLIPASDIAKEMATVFIALCGSAATMFFGKR